MQRTFVAITLALAFTCAFSDNTYLATQNYTKAPQPVVSDSDTNFTLSNATLALGSINAGELDIIGLNVTLPVQTNTSIPVNKSATNWLANFRKLDGKSLSASTNSSLTFTTAQQLAFSNGYAIAIGSDNDTFTNNIPQLSVYQTKVTGGNTTRLNITSNTNSSFTPEYAGSAMIGKNAYIFYFTNEAKSQINVTTYAVGATARGSLEFTLTTNYNSGLNIVWGEALGSNQLYANWLEGSTPALKYSTIDVSKGTVSATAATAWDAKYSCTAFATDKKYFGDLCYFANTTNASDQTINYYARFNGTGFLPLNVSTRYNTSRFNGVYPYGPYVAILYTDSATNEGNTTYAYDIYNFDSWAVTKNRTNFLIQKGYEVSFYRVVSGGLYSLTDLHQTTNTSAPTYSSIQVGLILGSSYLTSVLGFLMTIVAGVLLF